MDLRRARLPPLHRAAGAGEVDADPTTSQQPARGIVIVGLRRRGFEPEAMPRMYAAPLTLSQVHAALACYYDHPEEIEASIREGRKLVARVRRDQARILRQHRRALCPP